MSVPGGGFQLTGLGQVHRWAVGRFGRWAETVPRGLFLFFKFFFFSIPFLFESFEFLICLDLNNFKSTKFVK
jgi:hypothetical protein